MKKLPIGIQTFQKIVKDDALYIDKTKEILTLIEAGSVFFLSRPRRFGKSLLVSTLKEIFAGNRNLFEGLYIYDKMEWTKHPVIHIDFSVITYDKSVEVFEKSLDMLLIKYARQYDISLENENLKDRFSELIQKMALTNKVVVLIDEYDKPIIDFITQPEKAKANRDVLRSFYSILKSSDEHLRFVFLTGVTKFSQASIFSGLNNIRDITLEDKFSTLLGITKDELQHYFKDRITQLSARENISESRLFEQIRFWYNGYSWNGSDRVYNPTSLLFLFEKMKFSNYWFSTGTPTFLIETMRKQNYDITEIEETEVGEFVLDSYDIDYLDINALLLQAGYLTVKKIYRLENDYSYVLTVPNYEVKNSLFNYLISEYTKTPISKISPKYMKLKRTLINKDLEAFITIIRAIFAKIPYSLLPGDKDPHYREAYYHSLFYLTLSLLGVKITLEVLTDKGRVDGVLELADIVYVIEFKRGTAEEAIKQIDDKKYYEPYLDSDKEIVLLGVGGFDEKNIKYVCRQV